MQQASGKNKLDNLRAGILAAGEANARRISAWICNERSTTCPAIAALAAAEASGQKTKRKCSISFCQMPKSAPRQPRARAKGIGSRGPRQKTIQGVKGQTCSIVILGKGENEKSNTSRAIAVVAKLCRVVHNDSVMKMVQFISDNKAWIFSGIGVLIIGAFGKFCLVWWQKRQRITIVPKTFAQAYDKRIGTAGLDVDTMQVASSEATCGVEPAKLNVVFHNPTPTPFILDEVKLVNADTGELVVRHEAQAIRIGAHDFVEIDFRVDSRESPANKAPSWRGQIRIKTDSKKEFSSLPFNFGNLAKGEKGKVKRGQALKPEFQNSRLDPFPFLEYLWTGRFVSGNVYLLCQTMKLKPLWPF